VKAIEDLKKRRKVRSGNKDDRTGRGDVTDRYKGRVTVRGAQGPFTIRQTREVKWDVARQGQAGTEGLVPGDYRLADMIDLVRGGERGSNGLALRTRR